MFQDTSAATTPIWAWLVVWFVVAPLGAIGLILALTGLMGLVRGVPPISERQRDSEKESKEKE